MARIRIKDIAQLVGVSEPAASFALNGKPGVSDDVRRRVLLAAAEMGWQPNAAARSLAVNRAGAIGLVVARTPEGFGTETFFLRFISGVERTINAKSLALVLQIVDTVDEELATYRRWYSEQRVDGVLVVDPRVGDPRPDLLAHLGLAAVVIGDCDDSDLPTVSISDVASMQAVIDHLVEEEYSHLAYVSGISELAHTRARVDAFLDVSHKHGARTEAPILTDYSPAAGTAATEHLLSLNPRPDAILYDNEVLALAGLTTILGRGLTVPDDVAVVVWEDNPIWSAVRPHLTALRRDPTVLGAHGATLLLSAIEGRKPSKMTEPTPELIVRESSRRISP